METERLILRSWKYEDRVSFAEMNSDGNVMKYFPATLSVDESNALWIASTLNLKKLASDYMPLKLKKSVSL